MMRGYQILHGDFGALLDPGTEYGIRNDAEDPGTKQAQVKEEAREEDRRKENVVKIQNPTLIIMVAKRKEKAN